MDAWLFRNLRKQAPAPTEEKEAEVPAANAGYDREVEEASEDNPNVEAPPHQELGTSKGNSSL